MSSLEHQLPWIADSCDALWQHLSRCTAKVDKHPLPYDVVAIYLQLLEAMSSAILDRYDHSPSASKASLVLANGITSMLEKVELSPANQLHLASMLVRLRAASSAGSQLVPGQQSRYENLQVNFTEGLESTILKLCHDKFKFPSLEKDLQVSTRGLLDCY